MDAVRLRAWWAHRQGLDGSLDGADPAEVLEASGWARSVGGAGPYLTLHARAGTTRAEVDMAVAGLAVHELPSARGRTYVVPAEHFAVALTVGQAAVEAGELATARRLGVDDAEIEQLGKAVVEALDEPLDPSCIKEAVGDAVRELGPEGRRQGMVDTLGVALALLQCQGRIRRVPVNGRLDQQRHRYARWDDGPLAAGGPSVAAARAQLARCFLAWAGPASTAHLRWFTGLGARAAATALAACDAVVAPVDGRDDLLVLAEDLEALLAFEPPAAPEVSLLAGVDGLFLLRRALGDQLDAVDAGHPLLAVGSTGLLDLPSHAIVDRGRLVGLWEFDVDEGAIAWATFGPPTDEVRAAVSATEAWVRADLGDARSTSLDSPESRRPRVEALRARQA
jgi:hypothetical protein